MRILHVIPGLTLERGGPTSAVHHLTRHQAGAGHEVKVLVTNQGARHGERFVRPGGAVGLYEVSVLGPDRLAYAPRFAAVCRELLRTTDVAHIHSVFTYPVHVALREARALG